MSSRDATVPATARESSASIFWNAPLFGSNASDDNEMLTSEKEQIIAARPASATPTPTPTPRPAPVVATRVAPAPGPSTFSPPPGSGGDGLAAIYSVFGGSPGLSWALRVANCESHYNPLAVNRYSGASGLFQFMPSTWNANFPGWNIWDPYAQARAALSFYNAGRQSAWTCR